MSATTTVDRENISASHDTGTTSEAENAGDEAAVLEKDDLFHLLKSARRRRALRYLLDADTEPVQMRALAEAVAAEEYDKTVEELHTDERQRVYITLYQSHLPQLDRAGVIDYNQNRGQITTTPLIEAFETYLERPTSSERTPQDAVVPLLTGVGSGALAALLLQTAGVGSTLVAGLTTFILLTAVAIHVR